MNEFYVKKIAEELKIQPRQVAATAKLFAEGATVPFSPSAMISVAALSGPATTMLGTPCEAASTTIWFRSHGS